MKHAFLLTAVPNVLLLSIMWWSRDGLVLAPLLNVGTGVLVFAVSGALAGIEHLPAWHRALLVGGVVVSWTLLDIYLGIAWIGC